MRKMAIFTFALLLCVGCEKSEADKMIEETKENIEKLNKQIERDEEAIKRLTGQ